MSATERYLNALDGSEGVDLDHLLAEVEAEDGPMAAIRCIERRLQHDDEPDPTLREAVIELCDRIAREAGGEVQLEAALRAISWRQSDDDAAREAVVRALLLTTHDAADLRRAADATGGVEAARKIVQYVLRTPEVKVDATRVAELRRTSGKLYDIDGDPDRAFFELLKAVRKAPQDPTYVDEAFQLALTAERFQECGLVFGELGSDERLEPKIRATFFNKLAHLLERGLDDAEGALQAYERSLDLFPTSKGARRHRDRLLELLGDLEGAPADDLVIDAAEVSAEGGGPGPPPDEDEATGDSLDEEFVPLAADTSGAVDVTAPDPDPPRTEELEDKTEAVFASGESDAETQIPAISQIFGEGATFDEDALPPPGAGLSPFDEPTPAPFVDATAEAPPLVTDSADIGVTLEPPPVSMDSLPPLAVHEPIDEGGDDEDDEVDESTTRRKRPAAESVAATLEGGPADVFERAGTLLGGDDVEGCIECAELMLSREDRGSMALRVAGHALTLAATSKVPMPSRAVAVFEHEAPAHAEVAVAQAQSVLEALEDPVPYQWLFMVAAGVCEDAKRVSALLEPLVRLTGVDGEPMALLDEKLEDIEAKISLRETIAREDRRHAKPWLVSAARLMDEAGDRPRAQKAWAELALVVAPDDETVRAHARAAHEGDASEQAFLEQLVERLPAARVRGVREELARALLAQGAIDEAEAHAKILKEDRVARGAGFAILREILELRDDDEGVLALAKERLELAVKDGDTGDDELVALAGRYLARGEVEPVAPLLTAHVLRDVGELRGVSAVAELLEPEDAARALLAAAHAGGAKESRASWLEVALSHASEVDERELANEIAEALLQIDPDHHEATVARATLAVELGDPQAALAPLERLVARTEVASEKAKLHVRIGRLLEEHQADLEGAKKRYLAAARADANLGEAWRALASASTATGDDESLEMALEGQLRAADEEDATLHRARAEVLTRLGRHVDAEHALVAALQVDPADHEAQLAWFSSLTLRLDDSELSPALSPSPALLTALAEQLPPDWSVTGAPVAVRRLALLVRAKQGTAGDQRAAFRALLDEQGEDLALLDAYATHLAGHDDDESLVARRDALRPLLAAAEDDRERARLGGELGRVLRELNDSEGAIAAVRDAVTLSLGEGNEDAMSVAALTSALELLASGQVSDPTLRVDCLELKGRRHSGERAATYLEEAARVAHERAQDADRARALLMRAVDIAPDRAQSRRALLELELETGHGEEAIATTRALIKKEQDSQRRSTLRVRLAEMMVRVSDDQAGALKQLKAALNETPKHEGALLAAEKHYADSADPGGLAALYTDLLKQMDRDDKEGRVRVLDRLAKVRRYDLRDLEGAVEVLEAIAAQDAAAIKPREDAARLYTELGRTDDAVSAWRSVLERDPLSADAWRALFAAFIEARRGDEAFAIAQALVSVELGDRELERTVRQLRPPFPRWPRAPDDPARFKRAIAHPLERTPIRTVFEVVGLPVHAAFAAPLKEFGYRNKDRLAERQIPPSLLLAVRTVATMLGLSGLPPLYRGERVGDQTPAFALLPAREPGIVIADDALRGGMTPDRAFALGKAMSRLSPHALPASTTSPGRLKEALEAMVTRYLPSAEGGGNHSRDQELGQRLDMAIFRGKPPAEADRIRAGLETALRDYVHARSHLHVADWVAGVGYTGDRLGYLLVGDLAPCVRVIKQGAPKDKAIGARLATRELVLFTASSNYLALRHELGLALPPDVAAPILELA